MFEVGDYLEFIRSDENVPKLIKNVTSIMIYLFNIID